MIRINLDMDMPEECHECQFQLKFKDDEVDAWHTRRCVIMQRKIEYPRPEWCPLEYVPDGCTDGSDRKKGLKQCPFCGSKAQLSSVPGRFSRWVVRCSKGCCSTCEHISDHDAEEAWNQRAEENV